MMPLRMQLGEFFRPIRRWVSRGYGFFYKKLLGYYNNYPADAELEV
jgi:hypothetical protein